MIKGVLEEGSIQMEGEEVQILPQAINYFRRDGDGTVIMVLHNGHVVRTTLNVNAVIGRLT